MYLWVGIVTVSITSYTCQHLLQILGHSITTELSTYDCQKIYLKDGENIVGTIWANEEIRAPIKYVASYETDDMKMDLTMVLTEYAWGE